MRLWIYGAAPSTGTVKGVSDLLHGCTPEPKPVRIKPLDPPAFGTGVQLHMPPWTVDAQSEHEVCFATYYDVSAQVPVEMRGPDNTFCYNSEQLRQDPLSHHLIVNRYIGAYAARRSELGRVPLRRRSACRRFMRTHRSRLLRRRRRVRDHADHPRRLRRRRSARPGPQRRYPSPAPNRPTPPTNSPTAPTAACRSAG